MRCPSCRSEQPFRITAKAIITVFDDGTDGIEDVEWGDSSYCSCTKCNFMGHVLEFRIAHQEKPVWPSQKDKDLVGYCELHCETERALFHRRDLNRMFELAGDVRRATGDGFVSVHEEMKELCAKARSRHREPIKTD
jgi:hypothetical protein